MGWHRNHAISHSPNQIFFEDTFVSHPGGPNEQFGTHEKLSWGVQGNLNWMPGSVRPALCPVHISYIFFEVGIPNLVCGCIFEWRSVVYHFRVTVTLTLTSDIVFIVITMSVRPAACPVHISYILVGRNSKFKVWMHLGMAECSVPFSGHCDLDL